MDRKMELNIFYCTAVALASVLLLLPAHINASKTNDITYKDIIDWTEKQAIKYRLNRRDGSFTMHELEDEIRKEKKLETHHTQTCAQRALLRCDIKTMAKLLLPDESPCTLLKEYQHCIYQETKYCPSGEARLLVSSLDHLAIGLQTHGHCADLTKPDNAESIEEESRPSRPCGRRGVWMCTLSFLEDLKSDISSCNAMAQYRHCIHTGTQSCGRRPSDALLQGTKGLARSYRRLIRNCS